jgi:hypothetical protein
MKTEEEIRKKAEELEQELMENKDPLEKIFDGIVLLAALKWVLDE